MIFDPPLPRGGEIAVVGLGRSGLAATELLRRDGAKVYVSDSSQTGAVLAAAEQAKTFGADAQTGQHDLDRIGRANLVVTSPGISPDASPIQVAVEKRIPLVSETEIAMRALTGRPYIAVTGTNGKSTTTALIAHLLRGVGATAVEAGNIGTPLSEIALGAALPDWIALEMSSFQLHDTPSIAPDVGVVTNLAPDHLDRYSSVESYYADKALLFRNASARSQWVTNGDDRAVESMAESAPGRHFRFSLEREADACISPGASGGGLRVFGKNIVAAAELKTLGQHNVANSLAALLAVLAATGEFQNEFVHRELSAALKTFPGLRHRLEIVSELNGVMWINDSKATNVNATTVAVRSMTRPTTLLLGGVHKGEPYTALIPGIKESVRRVIAFGESASLIESDLKSVVDVQLLGGDFEAVIQSAREQAKSGEAVLLSPACSSFDMFRNFEERGDRFRELVRNIA